LSIRKLAVTHDHIILNAPSCILIGAKDNMAGITKNNAPTTPRETLRFSRQRDKSKSVK
jgi:hypothetical protein